ncbi:hypothetical protein EYZ11_009851 [Aspergillus tanneri]|uniref:Uncharacterized protein n=1 Tax=Aspergillus tanneri TaxID=1220188 RepID=A0A4S3J745_9EURO|nr:hypothetical protein EYZ11_009851 [Aspergillus tanneri]
MGSYSRCDPQQGVRIQVDIPAFLALVTDLFNACEEACHNPRHFQTSTTVTLRKTPPRDYQLPKS